MVLRPNDLQRIRHDSISISAPSYVRPRTLRFGVTAYLRRRTRVNGLAYQAEARFRVSSGGRRLVGLSRFELLTPRLSSVCSNQLSYRPSKNFRLQSSDFRLNFRLNFGRLALEFQILNLKSTMFNFKEPCRFSQNWIVRAAQQP